MNIFVSIGDSLLTNLLKPSAELHRIFGDANINFRREIEVFLRRLRKRNGSDLPYGSEHLDFSRYAEYFGDISGGLRQGWYANVLPMEIVSMWKYDPNPEDTITLLCTDTADSVFCAGVISGVISKNFDVAGADILTIPGTDYRNSPQTWYAGVCDLRKMLSDADVIIRTGGYSELTAYLLMFCRELDIESYFLTERGEWL